MGNLLALAQFGFLIELGRDLLRVGRHPFARRVAGTIFALTSGTFILAGASLPTALLSGLELALAFLLGLVTVGHIQAGRARRALIWAEIAAIEAESARVCRELATETAQIEAETTRLTARPTA